MQRSTMFGVGIGLFGLLVLAVFGLEVFNRPYTYRGSEIQPAQPAPDVHLVDQHGKPFQLKDVQGKVVLLFFGYTNCPDECPTTLAQYKQMRSDLGKNADQVQMVFITVDPQRDSQAQINTYLAQFNANVIGLTGSAADLAAAWKSYGVYVNIPDGSSPAAGYAVEHTNRIYAIDRQGNLRLTYTYGTPTEDMLQDVQALLKGNQG